LNSNAGVLSNHEVWAALGEDQYAVYPSVADYGKQLQSRLRMNQSLSDETDPGAQPNKRRAKLLRKLGREVTAAGAGETIDDQKAFVQRRVRALQKSEHAVWVTEHTRAYLQEFTVAAAQTRDGIAELMSGVDALGIELSLAELLAISNSRVAQPLQLQLLIDECAARLSDEQQAALLALVERTQPPLAAISVPEPDYDDEEEPVDGDAAAADAAADAMKKEVDGDEGVAATKAGIEDATFEPANGSGDDEDDEFYVDGVGIGDKNEDE
jgi:hypothetical protein